jgi:small subunit ribosomal protein S1
MAEETSTVTTSELQIGAAVSGVVTRLVLSGAFIDLGAGKDALLHISQMGKSDFRNIEDVLKEGELIESYILKVDGDNIALTMVKPASLPWSAVKIGETYRGTVVRLERFGAFIDIGAERPGMVHISEMADGYVQSPEEVVRVGDVIDVRVIKVNKKKRMIDLSMKEDTTAAVAVVNEPEEALPTAMELALRKAQQGGRNREDRLKNKSRDRRDYDDEIFSRTLRNHGSK